MINEEHIKNVNLDDRENLKKNLEYLIEQTFKIEDSYKQLNNSYQNLQNLIVQIIESIPNAIWALEKDGKVFLQNSEAKRFDSLLKYIDLSKEDEEIELNNKYYIVKVKDNLQKVIVSATDITEEKQNERLASMGQIAAHLAHEIRNPIGSAAILASLLLKKADNNVMPIALEIKKSIWRVERIIKATLMFTKGSKINKTLFDAKNLVEELNNAKEYYSYSKNIEFDFDFDDTKIYADFDLMSIALQNFLFNAIDAIEDDEDSDCGKIWIQFKNLKDNFVFDIIDNGKKIENKEILFEPFKTTKTKGNGLGLALSLQIIKAHQGTIEFFENNIDSENLKTFKIKMDKNLCSV